MPRVIIDQELCKACGICIRFCPKGILRFKSGSFNKLGFTPVEVADEGKCVGCARCALMCPETCIEVYEG